VFQNSITITTAHLIRIKYHLSSFNYHLSGANIANFNKIHCTVFEQQLNFVEICNVCARKAIIKAAKRIINSDKMCRSYSDLNFGVTFLEHSVDVHAISG